MAGFSPPLAGELAELKAFLFKRMYRHSQVVQTIAKAQKALAELFEAFAADPALLPRDWQRGCGGPKSNATARTVCDYLAGMTDRYVAQEYKRIFQVEIPL